MRRNSLSPPSSNLRLNADSLFGEPVSRQQRANAVRLSSPTAEIGKRGIKLGPVILLIMIVCAACLVYLWFSSDAKGTSGPKYSLSGGIKYHRFDRPISANDRESRTCSRTLSKRNGLDSRGRVFHGSKRSSGMDDVGMKATLDARPIHRVYVDGFFIDKTDVTNAEFAEFC